ncbi:MAG: nucleotidyl transferase AbiEii/AbiGii toxin family protein [Planctomycetaceae bacterium]|nr:nucleotidyl transferase AbiEii/AbiGii toxin family protein [Planctomycetaceae bacterium]
MSIKLIQERLNSYNCKSELEEEQAIREITQEVALAALGRTECFKFGVFQGGTCLRVFYGLNRFSEDLDFILKEPNRQFNLVPYLQSLSEELFAYGYHVEVTDRSKADIAVKKFFVKDDSIGKVLQLNYAAKTGSFRKIRIKLEIDTNPPFGGGAEIKYLDFPFVSSVTVQDKPSLFADKMHALLCREYTKGRDWYDFLWYTSQGIEINYEFLASALQQQGPWKGQAVDVNHKWCMAELEKTIQSIDWRATAEDVRRFVRVGEQPSIDLWSKELFLNQLGKLK